MLFTKKMYGSFFKILSFLLIFQTIFLLSSCRVNNQSPFGRTDGSEESFNSTDNGKTLTYWVRLPSTLATVVSNLGETPFGQEIQKRTGVNVTYIHPTSQGKTELNILLASGALPDIISTDWYNMPGGPERALTDGNILKLNNIIDAYSPNLKKYLMDNPQIDKAVKTDNSNYYVYPFIRGSDSLAVSYGPIIRKDWLNELGLQVPETIDEWYITLKAFKERKGVEAPLSFSLKEALSVGTFIGAFGTTLGIYLDNGVVKYGPIEDGASEFLSVFRKWYNERLIDRNINRINSKIIDSNILKGKSGASVASAGSYLGKWLALGQDDNPQFDLVGTPYPVLTKGERPKFGQRDFKYTSYNGAAISGKCKNVELAARFLDYGYSEEGHMLFNFGIEGESYNMDNGFPQYSPLIMNNPNGLAMSTSISLYALANNSGPFVQDERYIEQYYSREQQRNAAKAWVETDVEKYMMPQVDFNQEESAEVGKIMCEVESYVDDMYLKFIMGIEPIENVDGFVDQVRKMGIDTVLKYFQNALVRFDQRK